MQPGKQRFSPLIAIRSVSHSTQQSKRVKRRNVICYLMLYVLCLHSVRKASPRGEAVALATDEGGSIYTHATLTAPHVPHTSNKREAALCKNALPPKPTKNFPQEHPPKTKRTKSSHCIGGCSWGKFGVGQGGLEGRENPSERGLPAPPRSFSPSLILLPELQRRFSGGLLEALEKIRTALVPALPDDLVHGNFFPQ